MNVRKEIMNTQLSLNKLHRQIERAKFARDMANNFIDTPFDALSKKWKVFVNLA
jgi:hypothetical protein